MHAVLAEPQVRPRRQDVQLDPADLVSSRNALLVSVASRSTCIVKNHLSSSQAEGQELYLLVFVDFLSLKLRIGALCLLSFSLNINRLEPCF